MQIREVVSRDRRLNVPWERVGGPMVMLWAGLPMMVFVTTSWLATVMWAVASSVACAVALSLIKFVKNRSMIQPLMGLLAVCLASSVALLTGDRRDYFSIGIWMALGGAVVMTASVLLRVPLVGVAWELLRGGGFAWRSDRAAVRRYSWAALIWVLIYLARFGVQFSLYQANEVAWLALSRIVMGWPLFAAGVLATAVLLWRSETRRA